MNAQDIGSVARISDAVHGRYTERAEVYAERLSLYPTGCFILDISQRIAGYLICHPWYGLLPPPLDSFLGALPSDTDCFYLHDLALLPTARGTGAGQAATEIAFARAQAAGFCEIRLVAINGAERFWSRQGFVPVTGHDSICQTGNDTASYGEEALSMRRQLLDRHPIHAPHHPMPGPNT